MLQTRHRRDSVNASDAHSIEPRSAVLGHYNEPAINAGSSVAKRHRIATATFAQRGAALASLTASTISHHQRSGWLDTIFATADPYSYMTGGLFDMAAGLMAPNVENQSQSQSESEYSYFNLTSNRTDAVILELHLPDSSLSALQSTFQGSLFTFLKRLQSVLSGVIDLVPDHIKMLEIHERYQHTGIPAPDDFQENYTEGLSQIDVPEKKEVLVRFEITRGNDTNIDLESVSNLLKSVVGSTPDELMSTDRKIAQVLLNATITRNVTTDLGMMPYDLYVLQFSRSEMIVPLIISVIFTSVLVYLSLC